jgi:cyclic di-GMP phosphodiesterase
MSNAHKGNVLIVDDEQGVRKVVQRLMQRLGYEVTLADSGVEALTLVNPDTDLVLLDVNMPGMSGFEVTKAIRATPEVAEVPIILITTLSGSEDRLHAVRLGVTDFIAKPVEFIELQIRTDAAMRLKRALDAIRHKNEELEQEVLARTTEITAALDEMAVARDRTAAAQVETLHRLAIASEFKDQYSTMHIRRVGRYCTLIGRKIGMEDSALQLLLRASPLHDVGKLGIPDEILLKPGRLDAEERTVVEKHTTIGAEILGGSSSEILQTAEIIAATHHEWWNGGGYPRGLAGEQIPLFGRICAVADVFDALTSARPYKAAYSAKKAIAIMEEGRGTQFEPKMLDAFLSCMDEVKEIRHALRDRATLVEVSAIALNQPSLAGKDETEPAINGG